jgi:hypothetical protein
VTLVLADAQPVSCPLAPIQKILGDASFAPLPKTRLEAIRSWSRRNDKKSVLDLTEWRVGDVGLPWQPHSTGAVNAWGLIVLPGPGGDSDPHSDAYDWAPGFGETARHLLSFPHYIRALSAQEKKEKGKTWERLRNILPEVELPGVARADRLACWGVANLSARHAKDENSRPAEASGPRIARAAWIVGTCRPHLLAVLPNKGDENLNRLEDALRELDGAPERDLEPIQANRQGVMQRRLWNLPWGRVLVCRLYQHPVRCGVDLSAALTRSVRDLVAV